MKRELRITEDGSHTLFVPGLDEPYHSIHGAIRESTHVFLKYGFNSVSKNPLRILEIGFGTGLNVLLTWSASIAGGTALYYHAVEKYPLTKQEYRQINYEHSIKGVPPGSLIRMHEAKWDEPVTLDNHLTLFKERSDFRQMNPEGPFDLVYFDAFDPKKQPHLWSEEVFRTISKLVPTGGILVTYTVKGAVRRALISCGFKVEKLPGPPGKREMIRATKS